MKEFDVRSEEMFQILTRSLSPEEIDEIMGAYEDSPKHLFTWMRFTRPKNGWKTEKEMASWVLSCARDTTAIKGVQ